MSASRGQLDVMETLLRKSIDRLSKYRGQRSFDYYDLGKEEMPVIIPQHEQSYPIKLLQTRLEEYVFLDGRPPTQNRAFADRLTGKQVLDVVTAVQNDLSLHNIDPRYFVATCFHEAGCSNEWDTEIASPSCPSGFASVGPYQIGAEEAQRFGYRLTSMLNLRDATTCMIRLAEANRNSIRQAAGFMKNTPDPDYMDGSGTIWKAGAMRAYLAICHNHGSLFTKTTISRYGFNWQNYKKRNPTDNMVAHSYGEDCITGGPNFPNDSTNPEGVIVPRKLSLTHPFMVGSDVQELQSCLKIVTDGIFGPGTETALISFQKANALKPDGICGEITWKVLLGVSP